jgi:hypothetical protein
MNAVLQFLRKKVRDTPSIPLNQSARITEQKYCPVNALIEFVTTAQLNIIEGYYAQAQPLLRHNNYYV